MNPWNDNKKVQISRDAQEVEPKVGQALVDLWSSSNSDAANPTDMSSSREEISPSPSDEQMRHLNNAIDSEQTELKQQQQQLQQSDDQQQQEFYPAEMYTTGATGDNEPQYMEEYPLYSPPPFSPQYMPTAGHDYQQLEMSAHYAPAPPHMGYQQPPYPGAAMYGPAPPGPPQGNMAPPPAAYNQQEFYQFQYSPPRRGVDVYQRPGSGTDKKMYPSWIWRTRYVRWFIVKLIVLALSLHAMSNKRNIFFLNLINTKLTTFICCVSVCLF